MTEEATRDAPISAPQLLDSLKDNTASHVRLELLSTTNLAEIQAAIEVNTSLQHAELLLDASCDKRTIQDMGSLLRSISSRPNLRQMALKSNLADDEQLSPRYALPMTTLVAVLERASGLQILHLGDVQLSGNTKDFASLEGVIRNHSSLHELSCTCWLSEQTRMAVGLSIDPLLRAITASRSLQSLSFQPSFFGGDLTNVTLGMLCYVPTLESINISKCHIPDEGMIAMATAMQSNKILRELQVTCRLEEPGCLALAQCLRQNASLEILSIHNTYSNIHIESTNIDIDITKSGTSGDTEDDSDETTVDDDHYLPIALTLQQSNRTLQELTMHGTRLCKSSQDAFVNTLKDNYSLMKVSLLGLIDSLQKKIEMYCRLNRAGRRNLMETGRAAPRQRWVETLTQVAGDLDCLFYLLSTKPSLCDLENMTMDDDPPTLYKRRMESEDTTSDSSKKKPRSA
ncbi:expressed unknown protein [Seminavis robusta]|uniref:Uncharacterized protein n=1 Tax=Seminavis robusta TaxID=568900 RepID=A0A9N8HTV8_9STRA|nr:expressed unknown protein [Seminavis robusta]|eukprot:Sro1558_g282330.1 n/a (458) ;mRNA; r:5031-6488